MARIELNNLAHSYKPGPADASDWAVKPMTMVWNDGGAYALLGPSGCGKTTLLNIISGLVIPSAGKVLFDDVDVTTLPTERRNIAQVFQFPVIYDTMTVAENLAFPLRNRGVARRQIAERVKQVASMLDLSSDLPRLASGLTADMKQKDTKAPVKKAATKKAVKKTKATTKPAKKGPIKRLVEEVQEVVENIRERVTKRKAKRKSKRATKKAKS